MSTQELVYDDEGVIIEEAWRNENGFHNENGPAFCRWHHGALIIEEYWQNGARHRNENDGPAFTRYENGVPIQQSWWQRGDCHRTNGAAICETYGDEIINRWCLEGRFVEENTVRQPQEYAAVLRPLPIPIRDAIWKHFSRF